LLASLVVELAIDPGTKHTLVRLEYVPSLHKNPDSWIRHTDISPIDTCFAPRGLKQNRKIKHKSRKFGIYLV